MTNFGTTEILIILVVLVLLFGSAKLPKLARSLGRSAHILKAETKGLYDDDTDQHQATPPSGRHHQAVRPEGRSSPLPPELRRDTLPPGQPIQEARLPDLQPRQDRPSSPGTPGPGP